MWIKNWCTTFNSHYTEDPKFWKVGLKTRTWKSYNFIVYIFHTFVGTDRLDSRKEIVFFEYNLNYECGVIISSSDTSNDRPVVYESFVTFPRYKTNVTFFKPPKISDVGFSKWSPKKRKVAFECRIDVKSFNSNFENTNANEMDRYDVDNLSGYWKREKNHELINVCF